MPFIKISGLTTATAVSATNQFEINQNGGSRSATVAQVAAFARTSATDPVVLPAGTVSAPGLTFTGDTNTGIYSPAADTIAFSEGGVEAMRLDASGNVGIGTASPAKRFVVSDAGAVGMEWSPTDYAGNMRQLAYNRSTNAYVALRTEASQHEFYIDGTERMRITGAGFVGIGTSAPSVRLQVTSGTTGTLAVQSTGTSGQYPTSGAGLEFVAGSNVNQDSIISYNRTSSSWRELALQANSVAIGTTGSERMRIDSAGNVGIGTAIPQDALHVRRTTDMGLRLETTSGATYLNSINTTGAIVNNISNTPMAFTTNNTERMRITPAGDVGIGTASPADRLEAIGAGIRSTALSGGSFARINGGNIDGANIQLCRGGSGSQNAFFAQYQGSLFIKNVDSGAIIFNNTTGDVERMRIENDGLVLVGTTIRRARFVVQGGQAGTVNANAALVTPGVAQGEVADLALYSTFTGTGDNGQRRTADITAGFNGNWGGEYLTLNVGNNGSANDAAVVTSEKVRITSAGNVGIGTTVPTARLDVFATSGVQITATNGTVSQRVGYCGFGNVFSGSASNHPYVLLVNDTERMRINESGNVGIGTSSPGVRLDIVNGELRVKRAADNDAAIYFGTTFANYIYSGNTNNIMAFAVNGSERARITSGGKWLVGTTSAPSGGGVVGVLAGVGGNEGGIQLASSVSGGGGLAINSIGGGGASFFTFTGNVGSESYTERARITSGGDFLVGTTNANFGANGTATGTRIEGLGGIRSVQSGYQALELGRLGSDGRIAAFYRQGTLVGDISVTATTTSYNSGSDYRLKANVVPLTGAAARVQALKPSRFNFIADPDRTIDGFIAHEAAEVVPEAVTGEKDAVNEDGSIKPQGIDQSKLVPLLTAALQEALAEITSLKARVAILENK